MKCEVKSCIFLQAYFSDECKPMDQKSPCIGGRLIQRLDNAIGSGDMTLCYTSGVFVLDSVQTTAPSTGHVRHQLPDEPRCPPHFTPTLTLPTVNHARATHSHRTRIASPCHNPQPPDVALRRNSIPSLCCSAYRCRIPVAQIVAPDRMGSETVTIPPHP